MLTFFFYVLAIVPLLKSMISLVPISFSQSKATMILFGYIFPNLATEPFIFSSKDFTTLSLWSIIFCIVDTHFLTLQFKSSIFLLNLSYLFNDLNILGETNNHCILFIIDPNTTYRGITSIIIGTIRRGHNSNTLLLSQISLLGPHLFKL